MEVWWLWWMVGSSVTLWWVDGSFTTLWWVGRNLMELDDYGEGVQGAFSFWNLAWMMTHQDVYHWQELPQASDLLQQKFCRDKSMLVATKDLSWQTYFCRNKTCCDQYLSRQTWFCCHKSFVTITFCRNKSRLVATNIIFSQQNCRNKNDTCGSSRQW